MKFLDTLIITFRHIKGRLLESLMVVIGIALGVGIITSVLALIQAYNTDMGERLNRARLREIQIRAQMDDYDWTTAMLNIGTSETAEITFTLEDLERAKIECPDVDYGFISGFERFTIGDAPQPRGGERTATVVQGGGSGRVVVTEQTGRQGAEPGPGQGAGQPGADRQRPPGGEAGESGGSGRPEQTGDAAPSAEVLSPGLSPTIEQFFAGATTFDYFPAYDLKLAAGSFFTQADIENGRPVLVLGSRLPGQLYPEIDIQELPGRTLRLNGITYTIIGVLEPVEGEDDSQMFGQNNRGYIPFTVSRMYQRMRRLPQLTFSVQDSGRLKQAYDQLIAFFERKYGEGMIAANSALDMVEHEQKIILPILAVISLFAGVGLLIASINILNLMIARVIRRAKNIGISKAIGASRQNVFKQYLSETLMLGIGGGILGFGAAFGISRFLQNILNPEGIQQGSIVFVITWSILFFALIVALIVNIIFGIYPAYRASKTNTVDVLRIG